MSDEEGQVPLLIVQTKVLSPTLIPLTPGVADVVEVNVPEPLMIVQLPFPDEGMFPFNVDAGEQIVESNPALAVVGSGSTVIVTVSVDGLQIPFDIVQTKILSPILSPVTVEVGDVDAVTTPEPLTNDQAAVPTLGALPASVAEKEQIV